eukprot:26018-Rhodomonas_salina.1
MASNTAGVFGGAIDSRQSHVSVSSGKFAQNRAGEFVFPTGLPVEEQAQTGFGGALAVREMSVLVICDSELTDNFAESEGGSIHAGGASMVQVIGPALLNDNYAGWWGGAIANKAATIHVSGSVVMSNNSVGPPQSVININCGGGALSVWAGSTFLDGDIRITDNFSPTGGGLFAGFSSVMELNGVEVSENIAFAGGALMVWMGGNSIVSRKSKFVRNMNPLHSHSGGAIMAVSATIQLLDGTEILENLAEAAGGGIWAEYVDLRAEGRVLIAQNLAAGSVGGGIGIYHGSSLSLIHISEPTRPRLI